MRASDTNDPQDLISTTEFAVIARISRRKATAALARCHGGGTWHGNRLIVVCMAGKGGRSGATYRVRRSSLPLELQKYFRTENTASEEEPFEVAPVAVPALPVPAPTTAALPTMPAPRDWASRLELIRPILAHPPDRLARRQDEPLHRPSGLA